LLQSNITIADLGELHEYKTMGLGCEMESVEKVHRQKEHPRNTHPMLGASDQAISQ
jgi:hypothetical protein